MEGREEHAPAANLFEQRQTPALFGSGAIETIFDEAILANVDEDDEDGDGVFGVARLVDVGGGKLEIGRFGWKAQVPTLADFVRDAMGGELGITTPDDGRGFAMATDADAVADPEISEKEVQDVAFFMRSLAPPARTDPHAPNVERGEELFSRAGCATCHVPALMGSEGPVRLFSDLLLHDVMPPSFRGMEEPGAGMGLYRTPPLWGIRSTAPYMHDGRAETLSDAIAAHESEGDGARTAFESMSPAEQQDLLDFLEDL